MALQIHHLVEAAVYAEDLAQAEAFYGGILGLEVIGREAGRHVFFRAGDGVLLVFNAAETIKGERLPAHGATGPGLRVMGHRPFVCERDIAAAAGHDGRVST